MDRGWREGTVCLFTCRFSGWDDKSEFADNAGPLAQLREMMTKQFGRIRVGDGGHQWRRWRGPELGFVVGVWAVERSLDDGEEASLMSSEGGRGSDLYDG